MNFEVLKKSHLKRNILIGVGVIVIISACVLTFTFAKYRNTQSIQIAKGTINFNAFDIKLTTYFNNELLNDFPDKETVAFLNATCDNGASITFDTSNWKIELSNLTKKGTKCNIYFTEKIPAADVILTNRTVQTRTFPVDLSTSLSGTNGLGDIYKAEDDDGTTYYFAGNPTNNWILFGGYYWRIIRINGDGTIRILYNGKSTSATGTETQIGKSAFNSNTTFEGNTSYYVGLKYTPGEQHGTSTDSTILTALNNWYISNLSSFENYIDKDAGFCSDREIKNGTRWDMTGGWHYYAADVRLRSNLNPTFKCNYDDDLLSVSKKSLSYPIGLITVDEAVYAGLSIYKGATTNNYLYNGEYYWTMTPRYFEVITSLYAGYPAVFIVDSTGYFSYRDDLRTEEGIRPVINLKADVELTGMGTASDPYVVKGAN